MDKGWVTLAVIKILINTAIKFHLALVYGYYQIINKNHDEDVEERKLYLPHWECKLVKASWSQEYYECPSREEK